jgi:hypothetical protein
MLFLDSSFLPTKNNQDETYRSFFANTIHTTEVFFEGGLVKSVDAEGPGVFTKLPS